MLLSVGVDGYKSLRGSSLVLNRDGLTVLLGPNGAGKSSFFGAIGLADRLTTKGALSELQGTFSSFVSKGNIEQPISIELQIESPQGPLQWSIQLSMRASSGGQLRSREVVRRGKDVLAAVSEEGHVTGLNGMKTNLFVPGDQTLISFLQSHPSQFESFRQTIVSAIHPTRLVSLNPSAIAEPAEVGAPVLQDGRGLPAALNQLSSTRRKAFIDIEAKFREFFPWVEEIEVPAERRETVARYSSGFAEPSIFSGAYNLTGPTGPLGATGPGGPSGPSVPIESLVQLRFREHGTAAAFPAREMASGMLLSLALLWFVMRPEPDAVLCYDEPENSVHPYLLKEVYRMLRSAARGELGRPPVRILVATHSVDFVNLCEPEEVRVCERDSDNVRVTSVADRKELDDAVVEYRGAIGELWHSGALGGVPRASSDPDPR